MENFQKKLFNFKNGVKISDFLSGGASFEIDTTEEENNHDFSNEIDFSNFPDCEDHFIPFDIPFSELKGMMELVCDGVWKKICREPKQNATSIDFSRYSVTYERNMYLDGELHPFDSTWMNRKPHTIHPHDTGKYLEGILDALSTMKEGEQSYFLISYKKMFKERGCEPRVSPYADILCDLKVLKVEDIGNQNNVDQLKDENLQKTFQEAKEIYNDGRLRAKSLFQEKKYDAAIRMYSNISQMLEFCTTKNDDEIGERKQMMILNFVNLATCYNVRDQPNKTLNIIQQIEKLCDINTNSKILFAKGKALRLIGEHKDAAIALQKANQLVPNDPSIAKELEKLDKSITDYKEMTKRFTQKLFI